MDVIGNNIANVNTAGYKTSRVIFQDIFSQNVASGMANNNNPPGMGGVGGTNPTQIGLGIRLSTVDVIHSRAAFQRTDRETDMMINGDGFFIVKGPEGDFYTRAGNFDIDNEGYLVNSMGFYVMGRTSQLEMGVVDAGNPFIAEIPGTPAVPARLPLTEAYAAGALPLNPFRPGDTIPEGMFRAADTGATPPVEALPPAAVTINTPQEMVEWNLVARNNPSLVPWPAAPMTFPTDTVTAVPGIATIPAQQARPPVFGLIPTDPTPNPDENGLTRIRLVATAREIPFPVPQAVIDQIVRVQNADGEWEATVPPGFWDQFNEAEVSLPGFSVADNGDVSVLMQNRKVVIGQIAIAMFANPAGLEKGGNSLYRASASSGPVVVTEAFQDGAGKIDGGGLEMSNVDLSNEFTDMIVTQRGFQANSRIITVSDTMLEELVNLKR